MSDSRLKFRPAFRWEKTVEEYVQSRIIGRSINVPCGESMIGDVRVDGTMKPNVTNVFTCFKNEIFAPFPSRSFDTVISDPPWKIAFFDRPQWFFECVYLAKLGGRIIYNATWIPESRATQLEETVIRQSGNFTDASIISIFTKTSDDYDSKRKLPHSLLLSDVSQEGASEAETDL